MAASDYNGKEKSSLNNIKELFQYLHGGGAQALRKALGLGDTLGVLPEANGGTNRTDFDAYVKSLIDAAKTELQGSIDELNTKINNDVMKKFEWKLGSVSGTYSSSYGLITIKAPSGTTLNDYNEVAFIGTGGLSGVQSDDPYVAPTVVPLQFIKKHMQSGATDTERMKIPVNSDGSSSSQALLNDVYVGSVSTSSFVLRAYGFSNNYKRGITYAYFR